MSKLWLMNEGLRTEYLYVSEDALSGWSPRQAEVHSKETADIPTTEAFLSF